MIVGFVIWCAVSVLLAGVGVLAWRSEKPVSFFSGVRPPKVRDARRFNRAVAVLWFVYAALFLLCGVPILFLRQHASDFLWVILGVVLVTVLLVVAYTKIENRHRAR